MVSASIRTGVRADQASCDKISPEVLWDMQGSVETLEEASSGDRHPTKTLATAG